MSGVEDDKTDDYYYLIGVLDRILVEAKTLEEAKKWAYEALASYGEVVHAY